MSVSRADFIVAFGVALAAVQAAERVTKEQLRVLSRDLLGALHGTEEYEETLQGDIQFINQLLPALTPLNFKAAILFFAEFSGFHWDEQLKQFTKKIQKDKAVNYTKAIKFLEDPNNNIWTWTERNVKVEKKPFNLDKLTKMVETAREQLDGDDAAVMRAVFAGGMSIESVLVVMEEMGKEQPVPAEQE